MAEIASRQLRNDTSTVLGRVQAGEDVVITVSGRRVARLVPIRPTRRHWLPKSELVRRLRIVQADAELRAELAELAGDSTDDLGPVT